MGDQSSFFESVLPKDGLFCIARLAQGGGPPKQDKFTSIEKICTALDKADTTKENFYFAISTFKDKDAKKFRGQENALLTKCLILDVDVKDKDGYCKTQEEALPLIDTVCEALHLPKPIIVNSGYGYHVYWPFEKAIDSREWQKIAKGFHAAVGFFAPQLVADASRVSDSASILRIPGTYNLKFNKLAPVSVDQWHDGWLDFETVKAELLRFQPRDTVTPAVLAHLEAPREYETVQLRDVVKNCNWTQNYMLHMAEAEEPSWYAMMGIAPFITHTDKIGNTINGADVAHLLSNKHPEYTHDGTVIKFHQAKTNQSGPTTCAKLSSLNPEPCKSCPFLGAVKTPLQAAKLERPVTKVSVIDTVVIEDDGSKQAIQVNIPVPPSPYFRGESGGIYIRTKFKNEETNEWETIISKVYDYDLYPVKRFRSEIEEDEKIECNLWLPKDGMRKFKVPTAMLAEQKTLMTYLSSKGAVAEMGSAKILTKYLIDYTRHMQTESKAEVEYTRFGWRNISSNDPIFVVGNGYYDKNGVLHPAAFPSYLKTAAMAVASIGEIKEWSKAFNVYKHIPHSEVFQFTVLLGFAAPLLALTEYAGVMYNMMGDTGSGKSTAMKIMTSVWGAPTENHILVNDTNISAFNVIGYLSSIPVAFDESTKMTPAAASDFALSFTSGRGKLRADRNGQNRVNTTEWETIVVTSSNGSMYDKFTAARNGYNAESMRLFELQVPTLSAEERRRYMAIVDPALVALGKNFGVAGRHFIPYVIRNRDAIRKAIEAKTMQVLEATGASNAERFWATLIACNYVGASIAKKLGLHSYDVEHITKWAMGKVEGTRAMVNRSQTDPLTVLGDFFNANINNMIRIKDGVPDLTVFSTGPHQIKGRLEYDANNLPVTGYVAVKALSDYCKESNIDRSWLLAELVKIEVASSNKVARLATGTKLHNPPVMCIKLDFTKQATISPE